MDDPGFGHPFTVAIGAEIIVVFALFIGAAIIANAL